MILFLDIDGVLHPEPATEDFSCRHLLWEVLRACPDVGVVFSSSWRHTHPMDELIRLVTAEGGSDLDARFVGSTPLIVREQSINSYFRRELECRLWLAGNDQIHQPWIALDDYPSEFSPLCASLYLVDSTTGLTSADVTPLIHRLTTVQ